LGCWHTKEDKRWETLLRTIAKDNSFFERFNYSPSTNVMNLNVRSMYYVYSTENRVVIKVQRFIKDGVTKPFRAFLLSDGYVLPFAKALYNLRLGDSGIEEQERQKFSKKYEQLEQEWLERKRKELEKGKRIRESISRKQVKEVRFLPSTNVEEAR